MQEYPYESLDLFPGDLPGPGIERGSPVLEENSLPSEPPSKPNIIYIGDWAHPTDPFSFISFFFS